MAKQSNITEDFFIQKGYTKDSTGAWCPPPIKSKYIRTQKAKNILEEIELVVKEKVNNSPDFKVIPTTEWFITYNVPSKKNSRINFVRNGKQVSIPSKKHAEYVKLTDMQYKVFGIEFRKSVEHFKLQYPLRVEFTFVRSSKHSFDYCNACQTCEDMMKGRWFIDDSADYLLPSFQPFEYDKNNPGVRIKLLIK